MAADKITSIGGCVPLRLAPVWRLSG